MRGRPLSGSAGRGIVPRWQYYELTGTRWRSSIRPAHLYEIHTDRGARWFLDMPRRVDHLIGRAVHIEGYRSDFALIDVSRVWAVGEPRPLDWRERLAAWWQGRRKPSHSTPKTLMSGVRIFCCPTDPYFA